jgi:hypothetical protein
MRKCGLGVVQQWGPVVYFCKAMFDIYTANLIVEDQVIVELKGGLCAG